jgi:hypothetical protein
MYLFIFQQLILLFFFILTFPDHHPLFFGSLLTRSESNTKSYRRCWQNKARQKM